MDAASENKLASVSPDLASRVRAMAAALAARGVTIRVVSGLRSTAQQAALYANRANNPNPVAVPGTSLHEKGLAVDLTWSGGTSAQVGAAGEAMGLRWGGRFSRPDPGHFELPTSASYAEPSGYAARDDQAAGVMAASPDSSLEKGLVVLLLVLIVSGRI